MADQVAPAEAATAFETTARAVENLAPGTQQTAIASVASRISPPRPKISDVLWLVLVGGLVLIALSALGGLIALEADGKTSTDPDTLLTVFSSVLTGLIGLFVSSPLETIRSGLTGNGGGGADGRT